MNLQYWREVHKVSRAQLSTRTGISVSQISRIERRISRPRLAAARAIEIATNGEVTMQDLTGTEKSVVQENRAPFRLDAASQDHAGILNEAKVLGLDTDVIARKAIEEAVKAERVRRWNEENREAVESWNELVEREGMWSDGIRAF